MQENIVIEKIAKLKIANLAKIGKLLFRHFWPRVAIPNLSSAIPRKKIKIRNRRNFKINKS